MHTLIRATTLALMISPAAANAEDWWQGIWAAEPEWCANADRIGSVTPAPIAITDVAFLGYENSCAITFIGNVGDMKAVRLTVACDGEGEHYEEDHLIMYNHDDLVWIWYGEGNEPFRYHRCKTN